MSLPTSHDHKFTKYRLFAPGPTPVPEQVRLRLAEPIVHHRTPAFMQLFQEVRAGLKWIFQTTAEVLCLSGSGTAAMDGSVCNFLSPGDRALVVNGGKFGERFVKILQAYGCVPEIIDVPWGAAVAPELVKQRLAADPTIKAVYLQACETSTGVLHPFKEIGEICHQLQVEEGREILYVVDGITAVGVVDIALDRDHIDVLLSGSQKAFMLPPGLAFVAISQKAWRFAEVAKLPKFYLNFAAEQRATLKNQSAFTSSVALMTGLAESLKMLQQEGLPAIFQRHARMAAAMRAGLQALNCPLFTSPGASAPGVTVVYTPGGLDADRLIKHLRDHYQLTIAGGQDQVKGKIFRVAHMGYFDDLDVLTVLTAIGLALNDLGVVVDSGKGVNAASQILQQA